MYIIKKGKHRLSQWFALLLLWFGCKQLHYCVRFDSSWKQSWPGEDMNDVSKLIGIGCFNLWYLLQLKAPHHYKSIRVGIDYNETLDVMDVYEYIYIDGVRFFKKVCEFQFDVDYYVKLQKIPGKTQVIISTAEGELYCSFEGPGWNGLSYLLRPYMGGNNPARIDTNVNVERV